MDLRKINYINSVVLLLLVLFLCTCKKVPFYAGEGATLIISADRTTLNVGGDRTRIIVVGFSSDGAALHDHTKVIFSATLGKVEPPEIELMGGSAVVEFITGDRSGVAEIKARSGNITAEPDPLQIVIGSAALETLSISANPAQFGPGGGRCHIRAYAFDANGNLLGGIPLVLSSTSGTFETGSSVYITDAQGLVQDFLHLTETATVKAESGDKSAEVEITVEETPDNQLPQADFSYSPASPVRGEKVNFNGSLSSDPDGFIVSWQWDFGDGKTGSGERVTHKFNWTGSQSQSFTVVLKVTDDRNGSSVTSKSITVQPEDENQLPMADFSYSPTSPQKGETIYFNGGLSSDADGSIISWQWDFGDGSTASGETVTHIYDWTGEGNRSFIVMLTVTDDSDGSSVASKTVTVTGDEANQPPTADFSYSPTSPQKGETVYFNGGLSSDADGSIVSWQWDFGDGSTASGETVTHAYDWSDENDRTFTVILTVTDNDGAEDVTSKTVTVTGEEANQLPTAAFSYSPTSPMENETIYFNGSSSSDPDGDIVSWEWDFGDGTSGTGENVTHSYQWPEAGDKSFTVTLKVTDDRGGVAFKDESITVQKENQLPNAAFSYSPSAPQKGDVVHFNGGSSSDPDGYIVSWEWDFGDDSTGTGEEVNHTFDWTTAGDKSFVVILTVTDNNGGTDTTNVTVTVTE